MSIKTYILTKKIEIENNMNELDKSKMTIHWWHMRMTMSLHWNNDFSCLTIFVLAEAACTTSIVALKSKQKKHLKAVLERDFHDYNQATASFIDPFQGEVRLHLVKRVHDFALRTGTNSNLTLLYRK